MRSEQFIAAIVVFSLSASYISCSPTVKHAILSKIFDGVPEQDTTTVLYDRTSSTVSLDSNTLVASKSKFEKEMTMHPPFRDRLCHKCHQDFSKRFVKPLPDLCFSCHEPFGNKYAKLHGPVISGHCVKCHDPHFTDKPRMLKREGQNICLECHQGSAIFANSKHSEINDRMCTDCHSPHGGRNNYMLKPGSCYNCHDLKMQEEGNFKHGPVASEKCYQCHGTHSNKSEHKLLREGQNICYKCHKQEDILLNQAHNDIGVTGCTTCHNPHSSERRYMLLIGTDVAKN